MNQRRKTEVIIVSHTHWDREWYLTFEEFRYRLVQCLDQLFEIMERGSGYRFMLDGQVIPLLDYLAIRPENEPKLRELVRAGRLLVGPWYVQPDEFLVSGEALIRNLLFGTRISRGFGGAMLEGYVPDAFGHIAQLPQILKGFGIESAYVMRGADQACREAGGLDFIWRAPDGSAVLCHVMEAGYCNAERLSADPGELTRPLSCLVKMGLLDPDGAPLARFLEELRRRSGTGAILLMNGCDHSGPQTDLPQVVEELNRRFPGFRFLIGTLSHYTEALRQAAPRLPAIQGEFRTPERHPILYGVLSTRIHLKQANHRAEVALVRYAEPLAALARISAGKDFKKFLDHAWTLLLQNHAHDSICGTGVDPVYREMEVRFARAETVAARVAAEALGHLTRAHGAGGEGISIVAFNPCPWARRDEVTVELPPEALAGSIRGPGGEEIPFAVTGERLVSEGLLSGTSHRRKVSVSFQAELPPLGIVGFRVLAGKGSKRKGGVVVNGNTLENEFYRVTAHANGTFDLLDKGTGRLYRGLNLLEDAGDAGDEYNFSPPENQRIVTSEGLRGKLRVAADYPWRGTLEVELVLPLPASLGADRRARSEEVVEVPVRFSISLQRGVKRVDITAEVDNRARDHRLRVAFPTGIAAEKSIAEDSFWVIERPTRPPEGRGWVEAPPTTHPQKSFVAVEDGDVGFAVLNRGLPEYEVTPEGTVYLTLLRCVGWLSRDDLSTRRGHAGPPYETPGAQCPGAHRFAYAVYTYSGTWEEGGLLRAAREFISPPRAIPLEGLGDLGPTGFLSLEPPGAVLSSVKPPEDGEGLVVRVYNPTRLPLEAELAFGFPISGAWEARLDESKVRELDVIPGQNLRVPLRPGEIKTLRVFPRQGP